MHAAADFRHALRDIDIERLDRSRNTAYAVRNPGFTLAYCNDAWVRFASDNGGVDGLVNLCTDHVSVFSVIDPILRTFYQDLYIRVADSQTPESHLYACHSPVLERWYRMRITPIPEGLLVVHHLAVQKLHDKEAMPIRPEHYVDPETGFATQCCHCRSTRRVDAVDTWDWVPELLEAKRDDVSHGLCPVCFAHYFPEAAQKWASRDVPDS